MDQLSYACPCAVSHAQVIATFGRFTRIEWPKGFEDQVIHRLRYVSLDIFTFLVSSRLVEPDTIADGAYISRYPC